jgi:1-acyl-sn-glycerol-3-phosphate acyltransferase
MMKPTPELLAPLTRTERFGFRVADLMARRFKPLAAVWNLTFTSIVAWLCVGRRINAVGAEHLAGIGRKDRVLIVANHRSFFDFFVITAATAWRMQVPIRRTFYPVRANFFYETVPGILVNGLMSGMSMFPPIMRERSKAAFNRYALERCVEELKIPATLVGVHPEGTRNKGDDPYALLPAKAGIGKIALGADDGVKIIPAFVNGMTNAMGSEFVRNWFQKEANPINVVFGEALDLSDLRQGSAEGDERTVHKQAAQRCLDAIAALGEIERAMREGEPPVAADAEPGTPEPEGLPEHEERRAS